MEDNTSTNVGNNKGSLSSDAGISLEAMEKLTELRDIMKRAGCHDQEIEVRLMRILVSLISEASGTLPSAASEGESIVSQVDGIASNDKNILWESGIFTNEIEERVFPEEYMLKLEECRSLDWLRISPAIFGAMFQQIMNQNRRREWGAYYTSEENIMKVIRPLFLDELEYRFEQSAGNKHKLLAFLDYLGSLTFFDPACGCGNFLIIAYEKIRGLEERVINSALGTGRQGLDVGAYRKVTLSQFYGIEYEAFQAEIARLGLWMADRQMNIRLAEACGGYQSLPEPKNATIVCADALEIDWEDVLPGEKCSYVMGNPPFVGARLMNLMQKQGIRTVFAGMPSAGDMDYVAGWYRKAAQYMSEASRKAKGKAPVRTAFVSTNSISQGKQAGLLWRQLSIDFHMEIQFAVKSFVWDDVSGEGAKVHCVIIGFSLASDSGKVIYDNDKKKFTTHINGYLVPAPDIYVMSRTAPIADVSQMAFGSMPNDGGHLILSADEMRELLMRSPEAEPWVLPFFGSEEFIKAKERYCLWLKGVPAEKWKSVPEVAERVKAVERYRLLSSRKSTNRLAGTPEIFGEIRQPDKPYILVPRVSSCNRPYIPAGFAPAGWIAGDSVLTVAGGGLALLGVIMSSMHMAWVRTVAGRLKSDFRYSASIVYNNFPFPDMSDGKATGLEKLVEEMLRVRRCFPSIPLGRLYSPDGMPEPLKRAHDKIDCAVEALYGRRFASEDDRVGFLLSLYGEMKAAREYHRI